MRGFLMIKKSTPFKRKYKKKKSQKPIPIKIKRIKNHHQNQNQDQSQNQEEEEEDRLTSLPLDLRSLILSFLPLTDAVRTVALSSHWRRPSLLPRLDCLRLDLHTVPASVAELPLDLLFLLANPHVLLRRLEIPNPASIVAADDGLRALLSVAFSRGLQELALDNKQRALPAPWVPTLVLRSKSLQVLSVRFCSMRQASTTCSCSNLRTLKLERVSIYNCLLDSIVSSCVFLERLELVYCELLRAVRIHARRLKHLVIRPSKGLLEIDVEAPSLQTLTLYTRPRLEKLRISAPMVRKAFIHLADPIHDWGVEIEDFVATATELACLTLRGCSVQWLIIDELTAGFPVPFLMLKSLSLSLDIRVEGHMLVLLKLLESCPHLRDLNLSLMDDGPGDSCIVDYADRLRQLPCLPNHLEHVELSGFRLFRIHKELVSLLLSEARVLKKMVLKLPQDFSSNKVAAAKELLSARKGSIHETPPFHSFRRIQLNLL